MPERDESRHNLRLPPELKAKLAHAAIDTNRSVNGEILARLEKSFEPDPLTEIADLLRSLASLDDSDRAKAVDMLADLAGVLAKSHKSR